MVRLNHVNVLKNPKYERTTGWAIMCVAFPLWSNPCHMTCHRGMYMIAFVSPSLPHNPTLFDRSRAKCNHAHRTQNTTEAPHFHSGGSRRHLGWRVRAGRRKHEENYICLESIKSMPHSAPCLTEANYHNTHQCS